jgi:hypothetical protein
MLGISKSAFGLTLSKGNHWCSRTDNTTGSSGYHYSNTCVTLSSLRSSAYRVSVTGATITPTPMVPHTIIVALGTPSTLLLVVNHTNPASKLGVNHEYVFAYMPLVDNRESFADADLIDAVRSLFNPCNIKLECRSFVDFVLSVLRVHI